MDNFNIIQNDDANTAKDIDAKVKNKLSWSWLEKRSFWTLKKFCQNHSGVIVTMDLNTYNKTYVAIIFNQLIIY